MNYKPIGDYIRLVDKRNTDLEDLPLMGLSVSKEFFPSIANTIGTDMSKYKIVYNHQFTYIADTSRRGDKIAIALSDKYDKILVSQAYTTFEIIDLNELNPEYLMMWFRRPEFDRYARFKSHGSARETFDWEEFCNTLIPIPSIEKQREIVAEYNAVQRRIELNWHCIQKLEETAQALYRHYFVDGIDKENLPKGWSISSLSGIASYLNGLPCQKYQTKSNNCLPVLKIRELNQGYVDNNSDKVRKDVPKDYIIECGDVIFSWSGTLLVDFWCDGNSVLNQHLFKVTSGKYERWFYYLWIKHHIEGFNRLISAKATSMGHIKREDLSETEVLLPDKNKMEEIGRKMIPIFDEFINKKRGILKLKELLSLLLTKMGRRE